MATVTLSSADYNLANGAQFRFQCDASGNADQIYMDAIVVRGINGAGFLGGALVSGEEITELETPVTLS